jgi:hypothetical protein
MSYIYDISSLRVKRLGEHQSRWGTFAEGKYLLTLAEFEAWTAKSIAYTLQAPEKLLYRKLNYVMIQVGIRLHVARVWEGG